MGPRQTMYMTNLWDTFLDPAACMNTTVARSMVNWLANDYSNVNQTCSWFWMSNVFQWGYYIMPRKPGERIESPWTLGEKCWAFQNLKYKWKPEALQRILAPLGSTLGAFAANMETSNAGSFL